MGVWLMDCQSEILHNLLACFFFFTPPPPPPDLHNVQRSQQSSSCETLLTFEACIIHIFFFSFFPFSSWTGVHFLCVCVFYFVWFFFILLLELAVLPPFFPTSTLTPSQTISSEMKEKKAKFFFLLLSSSCEIELAKEKKMWNVIDLQRAEFHRVFF